MYEVVKVVKGYEITRMKPQIIRRLNQILGPGNVKSLLIASA